MQPANQFGFIILQWSLGDTTLQICVELILKLERVTWKKLPNRINNFPYINVSFVGTVL